MVTKLCHYIEHEFELVSTGITYPMTLEQIPKFEKLNPSLSFTILCYDIPNETPLEFPTREEQDKFIREQIHLVYNSSVMKEIHIDLMLLCDNERSHFTFIRRIEGLVGLRGNTGGSSICRNCMQSFSCVENLTDHQVWCLKQQTQQIVLPKKGEVVKFRRYHTCVKIPFMIGADFESFLPPCDTTKDTTTRKFISSHLPSGFSWIITSPEDNLLFSGHYHAKKNGENVAFEFIRQLLHKAEELDELNDMYREEALRGMVLTKKDLSVIRNATECCICDKPLEENVGREKQQRPSVKHHAHTPPYNFVGVAHSFCNLQSKLRVKYPIFIHNSGMSLYIIVNLC
jgi:hypothetical protein